MTRRDLFKGILGAIVAPVAAKLGIAEPATFARRIIHAVPVTQSKVVAKSGLWSSRGLSNERIAMAFQNIVRQEPVSVSRRSGLSHP